jgi:hypothetical protein
VKSCSQKLLNFCQFLNVLQLHVQEELVLFSPNAAKLQLELLDLEEQVLVRIVVLGLTPIQQGSQSVQLVGLELILSQVLPPALSVLLASTRTHLVNQAVCNAQLDTVL